MLERETSSPQTFDFYLTLFIGTILQYKAEAHKVNSMWRDLNPTFFIVGRISLWIYQCETQGQG